MMKRLKVCMIVQDRLVKGGIAAVISGYYGSALEKNNDLIYVESYKDGSKLEKLIKGVTSYFVFMKVLIAEKPDIIHIHSSFGPSFYRKLPFILMASIFRKPIINHIHGAEFDKFYLNASPWKMKFISFVYNKCRILIALSSEWKENLSKIVPAEKIVVVENYSRLHADVAIERKQRESTQNILFLGELGQRKGCFDIPKVLDIVTKRHPNVHMIMAGAGNPDIENRLKESFSKLKLDNNVEFPGWIRDNIKDEYLRNADIFFLPSYNEGMPMSILDAMGYALPVVSTNVGGIPKIVLNGVNGYCCNPGDTETMAAVICELLEDSKKLKKYGKASYEIVEKRFSLEHHLELIQNVYEMVVK